MTSTGALKPVGRFKGFGLSLLVEALAGALTAAGTVSASPGEDGQGTLVIAIDVVRLRGLESFTFEVEEFIRYVRDVPLEDGARPVQMPGEGGGGETERRSESGIPVQDVAWGRMAKLSTEFGVPMLTPLAEASRESGGLGGYASGVKFSEREFMQ